MQTLNLKSIIDEVTPYAQASLSPGIRREMLVLLRQCLERHIE